LANPAPLTFQLVGVSEARLLRPMAEALVRLGIRHGMVVRGRDGLDEVTTTAPTEILEVRDGRLTETPLEPGRYGFAQAALDDLRGGDAARNARTAQEILRGQASALHDIVAFNAGCAIYVADQAGTIQDGIAKAQEVMARGQARALLEQVQERMR
jgi:anthranilate phosphoribosyltransferase